MFNNTLFKRIYFSCLVIGGLILVIEFYDWFSTRDYSCGKCIDELKVDTMNSCPGNIGLICESIKNKKKKGAGNYYLTLEEFENLGGCYYECTHIYRETGEAVDWNKISTCFCPKSNKYSVGFKDQEVVNKILLQVLFFYLYYGSLYIFLKIIFYLPKIFLYLYKIKYLFWDKDVLLKIALILLIIFLSIMIVQKVFNLPPKKRRPVTFGQPNISVFLQAA